MHKAAKYSHVDTLEMLLRAQASIDEKNDVRWHNSFKGSCGIIIHSNVMWHGIPSFAWFSMKAQTNRIKLITNYTPPMQLKEANDFMTVMIFNTMATRFKTDLYEIPHHIYRMETPPFTWQPLKGTHWLLSVLCTEMQILPLRTMWVAGWINNNSICV